MNSTSNITDTPNIKEIKFNFVVPSYQRGYKWRKRDVEYLIEDLYEYNSEKPYYMQPIVTAYKNGKYILVDGQQRLTTFYLLWKVMYKHRSEIGLDDLSFPGYSLEYEKRDESTKYLSSFEAHATNITPDIRNFKIAEKVAEDKMHILKEKRFQDNFFKHAKFLWYELDDPDKGPKMFERLNGKRIALTDVELCKVLLLSSIGAVSTLRAERAFEWENMEYTLQNDKLYSFISSDYDNNHDVSRMALLLDLVVKQHISDDNKFDYDEYPLYNSLKTFIGETNVWKELNQVFHRIEQWYNNPLYYNLIGFLTTSTEVTLNNVMQLAGHEEFGDKLRIMIKDWVNKGKNIRELIYSDDKTKSTLLLFNILCELQEIKKPISSKVEDRFQFNHNFRFDLYRAENYDKEHVHATNSEMLKSAIEWQQWCSVVLKYSFQNEKITHKTLKIMQAVVKVKADMSIIDEDKRKDKLIRDIISKIGGKEGFSAIFNEISAIFGEDSDEDLKQNSIGNMALLSARINRDQAYAASPFAIKREIINERIRQGFFVPKGTERMFSKSFRSHPDEMYHWNKNKYQNNLPSDTDAFIDFFASTIERFIN